MAYYPILSCPGIPINWPSPANILSILLQLHFPTNFLPTMSAILRINNHLAAMEGVVATFLSLTTRITIMLRLEGSNFGGIEKLVALSILQGAQDNRDVLADIREATGAVAEEMDMAGLEKLEGLVARVAEVETGLVEGEAALRQRVKSYEGRCSDSHVVSF